MAKEEAVMMVNTIKGGWATLARQIVTALKDGKISPIEGMQLGMQGLNAATMLASVFQGMDPALRDDLLYVLEHGQITLPLAAQDSIGQ